MLEPQTPLSLNTSVILSEAKNLPKAMLEWHDTAFVLGQEHQEGGWAVGSGEILRFAQDDIRNIKMTLVISG